MTATCTTKKVGSAFFAVLTTPQLTGEGVLKVGIRVGCRVYFLTSVKKSQVTCWPTYMEDQSD
jgi:hypothetical protein